MKIQFNTDKTITGDERNQNYYISLLEDELKRFLSHITRIEVYLSDENQFKVGKNDFHCLLEARLEGRKPIAVSNQSNTIETAVSGAVDKLKASLETILERMQHH